MPKARTSRSKRVAFEVSPWQDKQPHDGPTIEAEEATQVDFEDLTAQPEVEPVVAQVSPRLQTDDIPSSHQDPWIEVERSPMALHCEANTSTSTALEPTVTCPENQSPDPSLDSSDNDSLACITGVCQLAVLPSGDMTGHLIQLSTKKPFGISACLLQLNADCWVSSETSLLKLCITNYDNLEQAYAYVCNSGGDMVKLQPAPGWQLREMVKDESSSLLSSLHQSPDDSHMAVKFEATILSDGEEAERKIAAFMPSLLGSDAVVASGLMHITGLPSGFFS